MVVESKASSPYFERLSIESPLEHYRACRILLARLNRNLYHDRPETWNLECAKAPRFDDRNSPNISNIGRVAIVESRELSRDSKSKFLADRGMVSPVFEKEYERLIRYPFASSFQPSIAALALAAIQLKRIHPPLAPLFFAKGLPIGELNGAWSQFQLLTPALAFELALLWLVAGALLQDETLETAARETIQVLSSLGSASFWLWRNDIDASGQEKFNAFLRWARGEPVEMDDQLMSDLMETVKPPLLTEMPVSYDRLGIAAFEAKEAAACFTLSGWNSGLGAFRLQSVEVRSFGPQGLPLSDLSRFGISQWGGDKCQAASHSDGASIEGWTRAYASKECWLQVKAQASLKRVEIDARLFGHAAGGSIPFVFYIKAEECALRDGPILKPRSLQRFDGEAKEIILDGEIIFTCSPPHRMQVIPLAGENCFWNAGFLISFEFSSSLYFSFSIN